MSMGETFEFFDLISMKKISSLNVGRCFSLMFRVNSSNTDFLLGDQFIQETGIGFYAGGLFKSAVICERENSKAQLT